MHEFNGDRSVSFSMWRASSGTEAGTNSSAAAVPIGGSLHAPTRVQRIEIEECGQIDQRV